jgi:hypothetical protein
MRTMTVEEAEAALARILPEYMRRRLTPGEYTEAEIAIRTLRESEYAELERTP